MPITESSLFRKFVWVMSLILVKCLQIPSEPRLFVLHDLVKIRPVPSAFCKACARICSNKSAACSPKRSKVNQCCDNKCNICGTGALKITRKLSCGCEVVKTSKGPVSLVREYLIQGNGAPTTPIPADKFCPPQQTAAYFRPQNN